MSPLHQQITIICALVFHGFAGRTLDVPPAPNIAADLKDVLRYRRTTAYPTSGGRSALARVAILGHACLDHRFWVRQFPPVHARTPVSAYRRDLGGPGAVGAVAVTRLGGNAFLIGRRGDDAAGEEVEARLRAEAVETSALRRFPGATTPVSGILVDPGGERHIFPFVGAALPDDVEWIPIDTLESVQAVLVDSRWPAGTVRLAIAARRRELPVVLDLDQDGDEAWRLTAVATHVIADEELAAAYTRSRSPLRQVRNAARLLRSRGAATRWPSFRGS